MNEKQSSAISPTRVQDYSEWYQQVIRAADLAELAPVRGCMVIKPWGYGIWENIQFELDSMLKASGHKNAYFPLFIPLSFLEKEAQHVKGFAKECAVVTHHRLELSPEGKLVPVGELEEPLVVRPTSETIIGAMFSRWVHSHRDLPLLVNQWANIVRWEMRTRMFLRTTEFLWQEGHTAHSTEEEAREETARILDIYADFAENFMAMPVVKGEKTESERFPGAVSTYCIEAMMQDRKALQSGTSHFLGQNFSRACDIRFADVNGVESLAWTTSWGVSTRLIGGLIMTHSDDNGLVLPPRLAPAHVVILPVIHKDADRSGVMSHCNVVARALRSVVYHGRPLSVELDDGAASGGEKVWNWIRKGAPIRLEIGPREVAGNAVSMGRRDRQKRDRRGLQLQELVCDIAGILDEMQQGLLDGARAVREGNTRKIDKKSDFYDFFTPHEAEKPEIHGGFALTHWGEDASAEAQIKNDLSVTIRCIPQGFPEEPGICPFTGKPSSRRVLFAKSY